MTDTFNSPSHPVSPPGRETSACTYALNNLSRRNFLRVLGLAAAAAGLTACSGGSPLPSAENAQSSEISAIHSLQTIHS